MMSPSFKLDSSRLARLRWGASALLIAALGACSVAPTVIDSGVHPVASGSAAASLGQLNNISVGPAMIQGLAIGPAGVVGSNIIAGNASRIAGSNGGQIIAGNASRYETQALEQDPIANALVYLTDPQEQFFANNGQPIAASTDAKGHYAFTTGLPTDQVVIVNIMLSNNRREVGFTVSKAGSNEIDVSLATTYVTEFLRERAALGGKTMGDYDLSQLAHLTALTQQALDAGDLAVPDLAIGSIPSMNQAYALAVGMNKQGLGDAWATVLGQRVLAVTTLAGTGQSGYSGDGGPATSAMLYRPKGIARDAAGNYYFADEGNNAVRKIATDGTISTIAGNGNPQFSGDGGPAKKAGLYWPRTVQMGPNNQLFVADTLNERIRKIDLTSGTITTFAGNPTLSGGQYLDAFAGDGGPATQAQFAGIRGLAFDQAGNLLVADTWSNSGGSWDHIRAITPGGTISSIVGVDNTAGYNGEGLAGLQSQINYAQQLAVDAHNVLYFADASNNRIRKYDPATKIVTTVAGNGTAGDTGDGGAATQAELDAPYGVAVDAQGRVFIGERGGQRIRVVYTDGTIHTICGGGTADSDGESLAIALTEPHDLLIEPDGNLLICDARGAKIRRLWLKWGL